MPRRLARKPQRNSNKQSPASLRQGRSLTSSSIKSYRGQQLRPIDWERRPVTIEASSISSTPKSKKNSSTRRSSGFTILRSHIFCTKKMRKSWRNFKSTAKHSCCLSKTKRPKSLRHSCLLSAFKSSKNLGKLSWQARLHVVARQGERRQWTSWRWCSPTATSIFADAGWKIDMQKYI